MIKDYYTFMKSERLDFTKEDFLSFKAFVNRLTEGEAGYPYTPKEVESNIKKEEFIDYREDMFLNFNEYRRAQNAGLRVLYVPDPSFYDCRKRITDMCNCLRAKYMAFSHSSHDCDEGYERICRLLLNTERDILSLVYDVYFAMTDDEIRSGCFRFQKDTLLRISDEIDCLVEVMFR